jgi:P-type Ca2+ transporter type 2C
MNAWYSKSTEETLHSLNSSIEGLSAEDASSRLRQHGSNELTGKKKKPAWQVFLGQFLDVMILILLGAAILSGFIGDLMDSVIILIIVLLNAVIGFIQEYRAEKAIEALRRMAALHSHVRRDGKDLVIPSSEIVAGDIVILEAGSAIPADLRIIQAHSLRADESALTGESVGVDKSAEALADKPLQPADQINMLFRGTLVINGRAEAVAVSTGMQTEIGKIAAMLGGDERETPLRKRMSVFGRKLSYFVLVIAVILLVSGILRGEDPLRMLMLSISLAVAAIPEALPALITIALSRGANRLAKKNALIRKLPAVETLGSVSYICSDKTGTLTLNKMSVVKREAANSASHGLADALMLGLALNHDVRTDEAGNHSGDPTEIALIEEVIRNSSAEEYRSLRNRYPRVAELPFDSVRKCMSTIHKVDEGYLVLVKGATESLAPLLLQQDDRKKALDKSSEWASEGIRVLAFGWKIVPELPADLAPERIEFGLHPAGLIGMIDPPREDAAQAIAECRQAGIHPVMITGDHPATARAIAQSLGIIQPGNLVVTGTELTAMSDQELTDKVEHIAVYARVTPEQKLRIVSALQSKNFFVAMTGDGVNDAPSLKAANIGVAMGINGTDVSKEAAHMILLDDRFATIVQAVKEGRRIYDNIRKFIRYILTCNSAEIWIIFLAPLLGMPIPLLPVHILWINLVTDGLPGLALASEKAESDVMQRPPRPSGESVFAGGIAFHILWVGLLMAALTLGVQSWAIGRENTHWQTMVFTVLALSQLGHALAVRSERTFLYKQGLLSNLPLIGSVILTCALQVAVIYVPALNPVFHTQPLTAMELLVCVALAAVLFHAVEMEKWIRKKTEHRQKI